MKKIGKKVVWVIALVAAFGAARYVKEAYTEKNAIERVEASIDKLKGDAVAARPDLPPSEAVAVAAIKQAQDQDKRAQDQDKVYSVISQDKKLLHAANQFIGFYYVNVKTRYEYCYKLGVDIAPFVTAFKTLHAEEFRIASDAHARKKVNTELMVSELEPTFWSTIDQAVLDAARQNKITPKDVCVGVAENGSALAAELSFKKMQPAGYAALHGL